MDKVTHVPYKHIPQNWDCRKAILYARLIDIWKNMAVSIKISNYSAGIKGTIIKNCTVFNPTNCTTNNNKSFVTMSLLPILTSTRSSSGRYIKHHTSTWCIQVVRSPNLLHKKYLHQKTEITVTSQHRHPVDIHIFHNADAMIAWPQQTLL
jgi:hypothetical protein